MEELDLKLILTELIGGEELIPADFFDECSHSDNRVIFLVSCAYEEKYLYISPSFKHLTGYDPSQFQAGSLPFWFSLIHPLDLPMITQQITQAYQHLFSPQFNPTMPNTLLLQYRFRRADGRWIWIEETKHIVGFTPDGKKDKILVSLLDITHQKDNQQHILDKQSENQSLLQIATRYQEVSSRQPLLDTPLPALQMAGSLGPVRLTRREKEVLSLLAAGLSTKEIALQLFTSINTVETHRRHLLEKFKVRNAAELIKHASQTYLL